MKKNIYILLLISTIFSVTGCKKFLATEPYSSLPTEQFYKTSSDAELAIAGCYNVLNEQIIQNTNLGSRGGLFFMQLQIMLTGSTDEAVTKVGFSDADNAPWGFASWNSGALYNQQAWFFFFAGIERCNLLLEKIDGISALTPARKKEIIGEAHFLRGFYYMYLGMMWGGVPVNITSNPDVSAPRASLQAVFTQAFDDFNFAYENLPNRGGIVGRANKWSAAGCLARSYAFVASSKKNLVGSDLNFGLNSFDWVDVNASYLKLKTLADDIIANSGYTLTPNYSYLFRETTKSYQDQECLFLVEGSENPTITNCINMQNLFIPVGANATLGGGIGRLVPVGELFVKYNANDTRRINNLTGALTQTKEIIDGIPYYTPNTTITASTIKNNAIYYGGKYRMIDPLSKKIQLNYWSGNYPVIRLAEIYMLRSEAIYYTTGSLVDARVDLSTVRARSVIPTNLAVVNTAYTNTDFVQELLDERTRELCFEGIRHIDLMRFNRYSSTINTLTSDKSVASNNQSMVTVKLNWAPYRIWFPIPAAEMVLNKNLVQNPGY
jgi:hypothetical protein